MKLNAFLPKILTWHSSDNEAFVYFGDEHAGSQLHLKQCGYMYCKNGYSHGPAIRDHLLIHFVISGKGEVSVEGKRFEVGEGQLFVIPPHVRSYYRADQITPWSYYYVGFVGEFSRALMDFFHQDQENMYRREYSMDKFCPVLEQMCSRMLEEDGYLHLMSGMYLLAGMLCDTRSVGDMEYDPANQEQAEPLINRVVAKIERECNTPITVQQIADELGVNRSYLTENFKKYTGWTVKGYLMEQRMEYAKLQIRNLELDIQHVAANCGYNDPLFFSRIFKKYVGCSPSEYRRSITSGEMNENNKKSISSQQKSIDGNDGN